MSWNSKIQNSKIRVDMASAFQYGQPAREAACASSSLLKPVFVYSAAWFPPSVWRCSGFLYFWSVRPWQSLALRCSAAALVTMAKQRRTPIYSH
jgi:hypothetical protein